MNFFVLIRSDLALLQVAIGGGGFIPARILRTFIKIPILAVGIKLYDDTTNTAKVSLNQIH
jgi:hypoxanthine phosphoribosyltransferase